MTTTAKKEFPAWIILSIIVLVAAALLAGTNILTENKITEQALAKTDTARRNAMPEAEEFTRLEVESGAAVDDCYLATAGGETVGYTSQITVKGYGGAIELIVGVDKDGAITAISVGGSDFSETAGLGAKVKDEEFTSQFSGLSAPVVLNKDVDAVSGATISSRAVTNGVNAAAEYIEAVMAG